MKQIPLPFFFNLAQGFEEYFAGRNAEAVDHIQRASQGSGDPFIFLWGAEGLGKTHLLHASCKEAHASGLSVSYVPLRIALEHGLGVLEGLESQQMVCLDDMEAIAGNGEWERGIFNLFNRLCDSGYRLIASARLPPDALPILLPDLKTRLSWGLTLTLHAPSDDDKLEVLFLRARLLGLELPPQVGRYLLKTRRRELAGLLRLLEQLNRATLSAQHKLTIPFVKACLEEYPSE